MSQCGWPGPNGDILRAIQYEIRERPAGIELHYVRGHSNNHSNDIADALAKQGANKPPVEVIDYPCLTAPSPLPPVRNRLGNPVSPRIWTSLPENSGEDSKPLILGSTSWQASTSSTHEGRARHRAEAKDVLDELDEARSSQAQMWRIVNRLRKVAVSRGAKVEIDVLTDGYICRMNPPKDPEAAGFNAFRLWADAEAAAAIPHCSGPSAFPELNELLTVENMEEVKAYLKKRGLKSAPGIDGIAYSRLMNVDNPKLVSLLNKCLEQCNAPGAFLQTVISSVPKPGKDPRRPEGWHGIGLQTAAYKMLSIVYNIKLNCAAERAGFIPPTQNGFRAGRRTNDNPFILRTAIEQTLAEGECLYVAFVDISNAFSAMSHNSLWLKLQAFGLIGPYFDFIRMLYRQMMLVVACGGEVSEEWKSLCRVLMGDPVSPTLWNLFLSLFELQPDADDVVLAGVVLSHLEHADDLHCGKYLQSNRVVGKHSD